MYFYNARWYDPALGRWLQPDVIIPDPGNLTDLDRYAYVRNNPVMYNDPSGHYIKNICLGACNGIPIINYNNMPLAAKVAIAVAMIVTVDNLTWGMTGTNYEEGYWGVLPHKQRSANMVNNLYSVAGVGLSGSLNNVVDDLGNAARGVNQVDDVASGLARFKNLSSKNMSSVLEVFGDDFRGPGDVPAILSERRVTTIGRNSDIEAAKALGGFRVLDGPQWTMESNFKWLQEAISNGDVFYLASPITEKSLEGSAKYGGISIYMRELDALL